MSAVSDGHSATDDDTYDNNTDTNKRKQPENNDGTYQSCSGFYPPRRKKPERYSTQAINGLMRVWNGERAFETMAAVADTFEKPDAG